MPCPTLSLHFSETSGDTELRVLQQDPPWRAVRSFSNALGEALVHLHNVSGGIIGGDQLRLEATLAPHSRAQITTVGATRVHRHRTGWSDSQQSTVFRVEEGALLEYLPDHVIPFAHSRYSQRSEVHLSHDAGLIWWETLAAGRIAHGECFSFDKFSVQTTIHSDDGPISMEHYCLSPQAQAVNSPARMGEFLYSVTMYVCRADSSLRWLPVEEEMNRMAHDLSGPESCWGVSSLVRHGLIVRGMARHSHQVTSGLQRLWQAAKQAVWGRTAVLPRKIY